MIYKIVKFAVYALSLVMVMYGLTAVNFSPLLKKNHVAAFYFLYAVIVFSLTYLTASFILALRF